MNSHTTPTPPKPKPGPKGKVLEPYADELLRRYRKVMSGPALVAWLAEPPRNVTISHQALYEWLSRRIEKLKARAAEMGEAGNLDSMWPSTAPVPLEPTNPTAQATRASVKRTRPSVASASPAPASSTESIVQKAPEETQDGRLKLTVAPSPVSGAVKQALDTQQSTAATNMRKLTDAAKKKGDDIDNY